MHTGLDTLGSWKCWKNLSPENLRKINNWALKWWKKIEPWISTEKKLCPNFYTRPPPPPPPPPGKSGYLKKKINERMYPLNTDVPNPHPPPPPPPPEPCNKDVFIFLSYVLSWQTICSKCMFEATVFWWNSRKRGAKDFPACVQVCDSMRASVIVNLLFIPSMAYTVDLIIRRKVYALTY